VVTSTTRGKSESVTFRIESEALRKLRREAGQKDISTNTLVNKLIKDYLNWYSNAAKAGFIPVRRPFLSKIIKYLPEQEIISLAEYVAKTIKDSVLLMRNEYTIKSALDFLESWIKISDYPYRHEETNNHQKKHSYVIQHDMGMKASMYLASLFQFLFDELGQNKRIEFDKTENTLAFTIDI
jgi:predicted HicB family RNase H-like nuclease